MAYDEWAFGENNTTQGETEVSWATWSDGAGGAPTITGDPDWGKLELASGEEARSLVYDMGDSLERIYALEENRYGTGQEDAVLQIRGDTVSFNQDDASPAWETYTAPITRTWRYVQVREINSLILMETFEANPGYDNEGWGEDNNPDPNATPPEIIPEWGDECLKFDAASDGIYKTLSEIEEIYLSFDFYIIDNGLNSETIGALEIEDISIGTYVHISISWAKLADSRCYLVLNNYIDEVDSFLFEYDKKYNIAVYYNTNTGAWEWKLDGISIGSGTDIDAITSYKIGAIVCYISSNSAVLYFDNIEIHTEPIEW